MARAVAAGLAFVLAAVVGVVTALVTQHPSVASWVALAVLVGAGAILQAAMVLRDRQPSRHVAASGPGAVAVGGDAHGPISTNVKDPGRTSTERQPPP